MADLLRQSFIERDLSRDPPYRLVKLFESFGLLQSSPLGCLIVLQIDVRLDGLAVDLTITLSGLIENQPSNRQCTKRRKRCGNRLDC